MPHTFDLEGDPAPSGNLTLDTLFRSLAHSRRRYILEILYNHGPILALADVAEEVAAREYETPFPEIDAEIVKQIYLDIYHTHIPYLADTGLIEYDQTKDLVTLAEHAGPYLNRFLE